MTGARCGHCPGVSDPRCCVASGVQVSQRMRDNDPELDEAVRMRDNNCMYPYQLEAAQRIAARFQEQARRSDEIFLHGRPGDERIRGLEVTDVWYNDMLDEERLIVGVDPAGPNGDEMSVSWMSVDGAGGYKVYKVEHGGRQSGKTHRAELLKPVDSSSPDAPISGNRKARREAAAKARSKRR